LTAAVIYAVVLDIQGSSGVITLINSDSVQNITFSGISNSTSTQHLDTGSSLTVYLNGATGTTKTASLTLGGMTAGTFTIDAVEIFYIAISDTNPSTVATLQGTIINTLNFADTSAVSVIGNLAAAITTVGQTTGSPMEGGLTLGFLGGAVTATSSSGNQTITMAEGGAACNGALSVAMGTRHLYLLLRTSPTPIRQQVTLAPTP